MNVSVIIKAAALGAVSVALGAQLLASPGAVVPPVSDALSHGDDLSTRYALAGIGSVGGKPFVVLLDRVRGVPIVFHSLVSVEDGAGLEMVGRGRIRVRIDGQSHELAFTSRSEEGAPKAEGAENSMITIHMRRQGERLRALYESKNYDN
jgi:hypothetical protein